jgi:hypothetical protein
MTASCGTSSASRCFTLRDAMKHQYRHRAVRHLPCRRLSPSHVVHESDLRHTRCGVLFLRQDHRISPPREVNGRLLCTLHAHNQHADTKHEFQMAISLSLRFLPLPIVFCSSAASSMGRQSFCFSSPLPWSRCYFNFSSASGLPPPPIVRPFISLFTWPPHE